MFARHCVRGRPIMCAMILELVLCYFRLHELWIPIIFFEAKIGEQAACRTAVDGNTFSSRLFSSLLLLAGLRSVRRLQGQTFMAAFCDALNGIISSQA